MKRRAFLIGSSAAAGGAGVALLGDALLRPRDATDALTIGILSGGYVEENIAAFHQGLRDHGWVDGQNVRVLHEDVRSDIDLLPKRVALLVSGGVRLIVATGPSSVGAVVNSYPSMPVVIAGGFDPVRAGFIRSFAEPSANVTGVAVTSLDTKRVEMLKQLVPSATRLAFITNLGIAGQEGRLAEISSTSVALGMRMRVFDIRVLSDIEPAFESASAWGAELSIPSGNNPMANARLQVVTLAARRRLPAMYSNGEWVKVGGLVSLGSDNRAIYRRSAMYVDKILRGASPAQIPVERASVFEVVMNRRSLSELGLTPPPSVLSQVTEWVD